MVINLTLLHFFKYNVHDRCIAQVVPCDCWPGLGLSKSQYCHTKKSTLAKTVTKKKRVKVRSTPATTLQKRPVKITMYLGLDIIIKLKFTTIFDRYAIFNVLNYLTKNFES